MIRPERSPMATTSRPRRERILDYLAQHDGRITSADGRGLTTALARAAGYRDLGPLNAMLTRLEQEGDIRREVRGRRTYAIALTRRGRSSRISAPATTTRPASARGRSASTRPRDRGAATQASKPAAAHSKTARPKKAGGSARTAPKPSSV